MAAEVVAWIDADGGSTTLDVEWAVSGRYMPPVRIEEEGVPEQPGSRFRAARHGVREFVLPLWITAASDSALRTSLRDLVAKMDPTRGAGKVRVTAPGGDQREITCYYQAGLEMDESLGSSSGPTMQRAPVAFRALDPYWYATSDTVADYVLGGNTATFFPFFPIVLTSSEVFVDTTVNNSGDVEAWPVWTFTGPGTVLKAHNLTTGKLLDINIALTAGETITVDTRPGVKTVVKNDGSNQFPLVTSYSALWPLVRGSNTVRILMPDATAASSVRLVWRPRYLSA